MSYKFLILDTCYPEFLSEVYRLNPSLVKQDYAHQNDFILKKGFGTADFFSQNLKQLGHIGEEIIPNELNLQRQWAKENGIKLIKETLCSSLSKLPKIGRYFHLPNTALRIVKEQIKKNKPEILYIQAISFFPPAFLFEIKKYIKLLVGHISSQKPPESYFYPYDLILTSFPHYLPYFRSLGIPVEFFKLGFEASILDRIGESAKEYDCTFVGGFSTHHIQGTKDLEYVASKLKLTVFGYGKEYLQPNSPLLQDHRGEAWGLNMYRVLQKSKITLNRHGEIAENYANNMRLYEATGVGTLLITDAKHNLNDFFKVGKEIVAYRTADELVDLIRYYLSHDQEREEIARAGQQRTLREHTFFHRMKELLAMIDNHLHK